MRNGSYFALHLKTNYVELVVLVATDPCCSAIKNVVQRIGFSAIYHILWNSQRLPRKSA